MMFKKDLQVSWWRPGQLWHRKNDGRKPSVAELYPEKNGFLAEPSFTHLARRWLALEKQQDLPPSAKSDA
jgi:hypothetical protein